MRRRRQLATSILKRTTSLLAVMVTAAFAATMTAGPSYATWPTTALATSSAGYGYFNGDIRVLSIHDSHADGYGVAIIYYRYDLSKTGPYYAWNREGNGTTTYVYFNMGPGAQIKFYSCPEKGGIILNYECGQPAYASIPYYA
ncbi:hypothetical protein ABZX12_41315 [Kribbella sp. NPDC003505]|uniref:hypothetical protein n=1 Tax=Kribbella sp. NPDC003505 TaxID=3154448 RepID=UPI0033AD4766